MNAHYSFIKLQIVLLCMTSKCKLFFFSPDILNLELGVHITISLIRAMSAIESGIKKTR